MKLFYYFECFTIVELERRSYYNDKLNETAMVKIQLQLIVKGILYNFRFITFGTARPTKYERYGSVIGRGLPNAVYGLPNL